MKKVRKFLLLIAMLFVIAIAACGGGGGGDGGGGTSGPSISTSVSLPETGQTTCSGANGVARNCAGTGEDGEKQAGVSWPNPRFTDNGNTVTDNLTGLMWLKDANCIATQYPAFDTDSADGDGMVFWQNALNFVAGINNGTYPDCRAGYTDWRLPNVNELESLINASRSNNATWLNAQGFSNMDISDLSYYWSSTTYINNTMVAWFVFMYDGTVLATNKGFTRYVLPVRGTTSGQAQIWKTGQTTCYSAAGAVRNCAGTGEDGEKQAGVSWPNPRFTDNGNTVTDNLTSLMWLKDANCIATQYPAFDTDSVDGDGNVTWQNALNFVAGINNGTYPNCRAGYTDWRLPNRKELHSLTDFSQRNPALPSGHPFANVLSVYYWSSTTYAADRTLAWNVVSSSVGFSTGRNKTNDSGVWPVRGGQ
jgi:hypothetical protein